MVVEEEEEPMPTFEQTMLVDTIRAMRKDKKDKARKMIKANNNQTVVHQPEIILPETNINK